jgi:sulfotransferase
MVGFAWNALREAFCGEQTGCLLALTYETLTTKPEQALEAVYEFIGEKPFKHDFNNIKFRARPNKSRSDPSPKCRTTASTAR